MIGEGGEGDGPIKRADRGSQEVSRKGYPLGFHFDPIISHEGWERGYEETVLQLFKQIDPKG